MSTTNERAEAMTRAWLGGETLRSIGARHGVSGEWVVRKIIAEHDPGAARQRRSAAAEARRRALICPDCGDRVKVPGSRCLACAGLRRRLWDEEGILERIQTWAETYGAPGGRVRAPRGGRPTGGGRAALVPPAQLSLLSEGVA